LAVATGKNFPKREAKLMEINKEEALKRYLFHAKMMHEIFFKPIEDDTPLDRLENIKKVETEFERLNTVIYENSKSNGVTKPREKKFVKL
jgi:hypothetical protein